jgi:hypothetical protein
MSNHDFFESIQSGSSSGNLSTGNGETPALNGRRARKRESLGIVGTQDAVGGYKTRRISTGFSQAIGLPAIIAEALDPRGSTVGEFEPCKTDSGRVVRIAKKTQLDGSR